MPKGDEQLFLFDTNVFQRGLRKITNMMMKLPQTASKVAKRMGEGIKTGFGKFSNKMKEIRDRMREMKERSTVTSKGVVKGLTNMIVKVGLLALAYKGVQKILQNMPEIGQAFGIAKDVFIKNLLYPLRKAIFPYLQKLLDWVRNNRLRFVKWGQTLVNIFKVVANQIKFVIDLGKRLVTAFKGFFERTFGVSIKNMNEMLNILTFKFAVVMTFLQGIIGSLFEKFQPALESIMKIFSELLKGFGKFIKGFLKGFSDSAKKMKIFEKLESIFENLLYIIEKLTPLFEPLGKAIGSLVSKTLGTALDIIDGVIGGIKTIIELLSGEIKGKDVAERIGKWFDKHKFLKALLIPGGMEEFVKEKKRNKVKDAIINTTGKITKFSPTKTVFTKVKDAIIKKNGSVIETSPDDNLIATKNKIMFGSTDTGKESKIISLGGINIDFSGMQLVVPGASISELENIGSQFVNIIREKVQSELESIGDY